MASGARTQADQKPFATFALNLAAAATQCQASLLTFEQQARLWPAWVGLWSSGFLRGAPEDVWRVALGYLPTEWQVVRERFESVLLRENGAWALPFMLEEADRQLEASAAQRDRIQKRWGGPRPTANGTEPTTNGTGGVPAVRNGVPPVSNGIPRCTSGVGVGVGKESRTKTCPTPPDGMDWMGFFEEHVWPKRPRKGAPGPSVGESHKAAAARWARIKPQTQENADRIADALEADVAAMRAVGREGEKCPHLATWLNQQRWEAVTL